MEKRLFFKRIILLVWLTGLQIAVISIFPVFADTHGLPSAIIKLPEKENVILVEKKSQTLFLYAARDNDLVVQFQVPCSTGEASGIKERSGDKKTPEGVYFLNDEYEDKYLSPVYGTKAFPTDYPNLIDKRAGKNGSAIWIHGTNKELKPNGSNGCVALENSNILKLSDYITLNSTPVIMVEEIDTVDRTTMATRAQEIDQVLDQWIQAMEKGSYHDYLSFYSPDYLPEIDWWVKWLDIRKESDKRGVSLGVEKNSTGIYYHNGVFVVLFDEFLTVNTGKTLVGKRKLFLEYKDNQYKIIGEKFQTLPQQYQTAGTPLIAAAETLVKPVLKEDAVIATINQWLSSWSAMDMERYATFYADHFYSDGMNKTQWVKRKRALAGKYDFIHVSGRDFKVKQKTETCDVSFFQEYESSGLTTQGTKRLKLVNKGGLWKIYQESWKEK